MLKSKKHNTEEEWRSAFRQVKSIVSLAEINQKIFNAVKLIKRETAGKKAFFGWSGGKDAQALRVVCELAGITTCVLGAPAKELEYPSFNQYIEEHGPAGLHIIRTKIDLDYLEANPEMLFPTDFYYDEKWANIFIRQPWYDYCKETGAEVIILGNRTQDGNICGKDGVYYKGKLKKVCPIYNFTHEDVFAVLQYYNMPLSPQYWYKDGFKYGSHPWAKRTAMYSKDKETPMKEIMQIDPTIIPTYAPRLTILREFCNKYGINY